VVALTLKLISFQALRQKTAVWFSWTIEESSQLEQVIQEGSVDGENFQALHLSSAPSDGSAIWSNELFTPVPDEIRFVRLKMISRLQEQHFSPILLLGSSISANTDRLYPNPTSGNLTLVTEVPVSGIGEIKILHLGGGMVRTHKLPIQKGANRLSIDLRDLPKGIYLIQLSVSNGAFTRWYRISKY